VLWLGVCSTGGGNLLYYVLMRRVAVGFASLNNYIVPLMALGWGYFLLDEQPHLNALVALVLILAGLALPRIVAAKRHPAQKTTNPG
jgi:drug/metabolite transporter (DMT)-like permease